MEVFKLDKTKSNENFLKDAYNIYSNKFKSVLILTIFFYIPFYTIFFGSSTLIMSKYPDSIDFSGVAIPLASIILNIVVIFLNVIFSPLFMASMYFLVKNFLSNEDINYKNIIKDVLKLWPFIILTSIIYYFLICLAVPIFIFIPYIITVFYFYIFSICEGYKNPIHALKYSFKIVKGKFLITFAIILLTSLLSSFITNILFSVVSISGMPDNVVLSIFYNLVGTIINAYFHIFLAIWFINRTGEIEQN